MADIATLRRDHLSSVYCGGMPHEFRLPDIGEGLTEAEIVQWFVSEGDTIEVDAPVIEIETAKTSVEITAPHAGTVLALGGAPGDTINVGEILFVVGEKGETVKAPVALSRATAERGTSEAGGSSVEPPSPDDSLVPPEKPTAGVKAMPVVRKLAGEKGVDLTTIVGTGPGGAITRADVERRAQSGAAQQVTPLSRKRKAIARHMAESWATIPHVTIQADVRAEELLAARKLRAFKDWPIEPLVAMAVLPLLKRYREFNASMHGDAVAYRDRYNLGFAIDTEAGLMVVVVKDADQLSFDEIATDFERLKVAALAGTLTPGEVTGGTFTISNIGALGGGHGTPIIPVGTTAILSIGRAKEVPVADEGVLALGFVAPIDLSFDHRLIDGSLGQRFLNDLVTNLTDVAVMRV